MPRLLTRHYIYDAAQRILHWWIGLATLLMITSGLIGANMEAGSGRAYMWDLHTVTGYALIVGAVGRLVWGLFGPEHGRFGSLFHVRAWVKTLRTRRIESADGPFGHHPQAALSYLGFYGLLFMMCSSGLTLAGILHGQGPLALETMDDFTQLDTIREVHEICMWLIVGFIVAHIAALIVHETKDKIPVSQSMVSGYQYRTVGDAHTQETKHETPAT
jgi:Ni,Fe-hydrogenase I cytochrome b subunit